MSGRIRSGALRWLSLFLAFGLIAAACSSDGGGDAVDTPGTDAPSSTDAPDGTDGTTAPGESTDPTEPPGPEMTPEYGGDLVFGVEAETNTGFAMGSAQCANSCHQVMRAITDPMTIIDSNGDVQPYLAESFTPNDDFTEWTVGLREGVQFHNGEVLDADAYIVNIEANKNGAILGQILQDLESWEKVDDLTVKMTYSRPNSQVPGGLDGQVGYVLAPESLNSEDGGSGSPIGTGPFVFTEWQRDNFLRAERNPNYWKTGPNGEELPYLDSVTFRPIPEKETRKNAMENEDLHVNVSSFTEDHAFWQDNFDVMPESDFLETSYILVNNAAPPMDDVRVRRGLAMCIDYATYIALRAPGGTPANGPFPPGLPGNLADTGYPVFDPAGGKALIDEAIADGVDMSSLEYGTTPIDSNVQTAELITGMWRDNCGVQAGIQTIEQGEFITVALLGNFQVFLWRNHGSASPSNEYVWWHSRHSGPIGELALANFGRIENDAVDAALDGVRASGDPAEQQAFAEDINTAMAEDVSNFWLTWIEWDVASQDYVHLGPVSLPEGGESLPHHLGRPFLAESWMDPGSGG